MDEKRYYVWYVFNRVWTENWPPNGKQPVDARGGRNTPTPDQYLTLSVAQAWCEKLNKSSGPGEYEVWDVPCMRKAGPPILGCATVISTTIAVNNHTCPTCKNTRCSKAEKTCWSCGNQL